MHSGCRRRLGVGGACNHCEAGRREPEGQQGPGDDSGGGVDDVHAACPLPLMRQVGWLLCNHTPVNALPIPTCKAWRYRRCAAASRRANSGDWIE